MTSNNKINTLSEYEIIDLDNQIKRNRFFTILTKNKKVISIFGALGLLISGIISYNIKKTWQGEFQIVIDSSNNEKLTSLVASSNLGSSENKILNNLIDTGSSKKYRLQTEIGILKSPSVLKNIFDFVKKKKKAKNDPDYKSLNYFTWIKKDIDIELEKGTNILNISYRDKDKELIIPVLDEISKAYQTYSKKKKDRGIELGFAFLEKQIDLYTLKSNDAQRKAQEYAIENDLSINENAELSLRLKLSNQIRAIDEEIKKLESLKTFDEKLMFIEAGSYLPNYLNKMKSLDLILSEKRMSYKEHDKEIQQLLKNRISLGKLIISKTKSLLNSNKEKANAIYIAASRPKDVLIKYSSLISKAQRNKAVLDSLETQNTILLLEKARLEDPWELITNPTLLPSAYAPRKKRIMALGLITGLLIGSSYSILIERFKDKILTTKEIKLYTDWKFLAEIPTFDKEQFDESIKLLNKGINSDDPIELGFLILGEITDERKDQFSKTVKKYFSNKKLIISENISDVFDISKLIIVVALNITDKKSLLSVAQKLLIRESPLGYIIFI